MSTFKCKINKLPYELSILTGLGEEEHLSQPGHANQESLTVTLIALGISQSMGLSEFLLSCSLPL